MEDAITLGTVCTTWGAWGGRREEERRDEEIGGVFVRQECEKGGQ